MGYWTSFIANLNPEPTQSKRDGACLQVTGNLKRMTSVPTWNQYTSTSTTGEVLALGGDGQVSACPPTSFWGGTVQYDSLLFG